MGFLRTSLGACALATTVATAACVASYDHTQITSSTATMGDLPSVVEADRVELQHGGIAVVHAAPFNDDDKPMRGEMRSRDPSVVRVDYAEGDKNYALVALKEGATDLELLADGSVVRVVTVRVSPQHAP